MGMRDFQTDRWSAVNMSAGRGGDVSGGEGASIFQGFHRGGVKACYLVLQVSGLPVLFLWRMGLGRVTV